MVEIVSFGCRLNGLESELIRSRPVGAGLDDAIVINSYAVTAEAERQARHAPGFGISTEEKVKVDDIMLLAKVA